MLHATPPTWGHYLPGYGGSRLLVEGAISPVFNQTGAVLIGLGWVVGLTAVAILLCRATMPRGTSSRLAGGSVATGWLRNSHRLHSGPQESHP